MVFFSVFSRSNAHETPEALNKMALGAELIERGNVCNRLCAGSDKKGGIFNPSAENIVVDRFAGFPPENSGEIVRVQVYRVCNLRNGKLFAQMVFNITDCAADNIGILFGFEAVDGSRIPDHHFSLKMKNCRDVAAGFNLLDIGIGKSESIVGADPS